MSKDGNSFIVALSSVAGLRGRAKQLFYSSAKSALITYMSGLRQKFDKKINIITVVPGYIRTNTFEKGNWKAPSFLISSPHKAAKIIYKAIKYKKEIVYINFIWRLIMFFIVHIPEKIFMKLNISNLVMAGKKPDYINFKFQLIIRDLKNFTNFIAELKQKGIKFKIIRHEDKRNAFTQKILRYFKKN